MKLACLFRSLIMGDAQNVVFDIHFHFPGTIYLIFKLYCQIILYSMQALCFLDLFLFESAIDRRTIEDLQKGVSITNEHAKSRDRRA